METAGIEYMVTDNTEFDGINGLQDLAVGDKVEVEYEEKSGGREALEIVAQEPRWSEYATQNAEVIVVAYGTAVKLR